MSAARLTTPNPTTVRHGDHDHPTLLEALDETTSPEVAGRPVAGFFTTPPALPR
jgi:hypothetical protein